MVDEVIKNLNVSSYDELIQKLKDVSNKSEEEQELVLRDLMDEKQFEMFKDVFKALVKHKGK